MPEIRTVGIPPSEVSNYLKPKLQRDLLASMGSYLREQKPGACYFVATEEIKLIKPPPGLEGKKRFRAVMAANHKGVSMDVIGLYIFSADETTGTQAIQDAKTIMAAISGLPVQALQERNN